MTEVLRNICIAGLVACIAGVAADNQPSTVQGVLIDKDCSYKAETRVVPGGHLEGGMLTAYTHTRNCLLMPACQRSGYGVFTYNTYKFPFDEAGNRQALALIKNAKKDDDFRVEVTGKIDGDVMKVASMKLLP